MPLFRFLVMAIQDVLIMVILYVWEIKVAVIIPIHPVIKYMLIKANVKVVINCIGVIREVLNIFNVIVLRTLR